MPLLRKLAAILIFLIIASIIAILILGQVKTMRYPRLTFDPQSQPHALIDAGFRIEADGAYVKSKQLHIFRAFSPSVSLLLTNFPEQGVTVKLENIHPDAVLETNSITAISRGYITEIIDGLSRVVHISAPGSRVNLSWHFPKQANYRFGVLGDTGGNRELDWGLKRLAELQVDFILHLGDIYYHPTEIGQVHQRLNRSKVPVYTAIGNHDFHGPQGNTYNQFSRNIGPFNAAFQLLDSCFINLDTASNMYPADKGHRNDFLKGLLQSSTKHSTPPLAQCEKIVFTHKPFTDGLMPNSIPNQGHSMDNYQANGLREWFTKMGKITLLAGHIHDDFEFSLPGIKTYVTGSGLAVKDLLQDRPVAKYLLGQIEEGQAVEFSWKASNMPLGYHCSQKVWHSLKKDRPKLLYTLQQACTP